MRPLVFRVLVEIEVILIINYPDGKDAGAILLCKYVHVYFINSIIC